MSKTLKIGIVFDDTLDKPDGVQQYILSLRQWLTRQGHEVHFLVGATNRRDLEHVHSLSHNLAVRFNGNRLSVPLPASRRRIRQILRQENFDVLHIQVPYSPWLAGRVISLANKRRTAIVGTFHIAPHSPLVTVAARLLAIWTAKTLGLFTVIISVSAAASRFARTAYRLKTEVVPNMFDYRRFASAKRLLAANPNNRLTILFLGRLVPRKGALTLLQAINELSDRRQTPDFEVIIAGSGPLENKLKTYVRQNGLDERVRFWGFVEESDKPGLLASADIAVFPSSGGESFGIVLLEAMASGRAAVLAGDNPGYRSVLYAHPEMLFNPKESSVLTAKLAEYLIDEERRKQLARWGKSTAAGYDNAAVGPKVEAIYVEALRKVRGR